MAIQTMVIVQILLVTCVSIHYGFCRSTCKRGNLSKDLPLVPGLVPDESNGAVVQSQWWEDALCHPMSSIANVFLDGNNNNNNNRNDEMVPPGHTGSSVADSWTSAKLDMMLAVENVTQLPQWIEIVSRSLHEENDNSAPSSFASMLSSNPMGLKIIPPLPLDTDGISAAAIWSHYKRHISKEKSLGQQSLVVYIPASLSISDKETIEWKAFDVSSTTSSAEKTSTTMVLPWNSPHGEGTSTAGRLQPLVEDWMARSMILAQQQKQENINSDASTTLPKSRLTREFPIEHLLAVMMPLLFPLILPFLVSWVKEYKRYKELTASKKGSSAESTNAGATAKVERPSSEE